MDIKDFEMAAASCTKMLPRTKDAAHRILVNGERVRAVARDIGISPQAVSLATNRITAAYKRFRGLPENWVTISVTVPKETARKIKEMERDALELYGYLSHQDNWKDKQINLI